MRNLAIAKTLIGGVTRWWIACAIQKPVDYVYAVNLLASTLIVLGMGPTLQNYFASFVTSTEANIYDAAYQNAIHRFPDYLGWLAPSVDPGVVFPGIAIWCAVLASSHARTALMRGYAAAVLAITTTDMVVLVISDTFALDQIVTCIASNIVGGFVVALIVVLIRSAATYVAKFERHSAATLVVALSLPAVIAVSISGSVFIIAKTLYDPTPVDYRATVSPKSWGYFKTTLPREATDNRDVKNFQLFDQAATNKEVRWLGISSPLTITWKSEEDYDLKIYLFEGCGFDTTLPVDFEKRPFIRFNGIQSLDVSVDKGLAEYTLLSGSNQLLSSREEEFSNVSIDQEDDEPVKYTLHASEDATLIHSQHGRKRLFVSTFLIDTEQSSKKPWKTRQIEFSVGGKSFWIIFNPELSPSRSSPSILCRPIGAKYTADRPHVNVTSPLASVVFELDRGGREENFTGHEMSSDKITSKGASGWLILQADTTGHEEEDVLSKGQTDFVVLSGKYDELLVAGAAMPTSNINSLQAFGGVTNVSVSKGGVITLDGKANALYWNQERLNKTRWEKIDAGWATFLLSWMAGLIFITYKGIRSSLIENFELGTPL